MNSRILFIDDHPVLRRGIEELLSDGLPDARFGHAGDARQAIEHLRAARWDVAVVDLNLPGRGGLELIRTLKDEQPGLAVLVYSVHSPEQFGFRAIRAGADGYLSKDRPPEELKEAVERLLRGGQYITQELAATLVAGVQGKQRQNHQLLSDREVEVLRMLAGGQNPAEIAEQLSLSAKTVSTYRARVLQKLNLRTNAHLVRYAIEHGIVD